MTASFPSCLPSVRPFVRGAFAHTPIQGVLRRVSFLVCCGLVAGLCVAPVSAAQAQAHEQQAPPARSQSVQQSPQSSAPGDVPSWAEPGHAQRGSNQGAYGRQNDGTVQTNAPALPDNPKRTPIGGLEWLIAAALGYGTYRLTGDRSEV